MQSVPHLGHWPDSSPSPSHSAKPPNHRHRGHCIGVSVMETSCPDENSRCAMASLYARTSASSPAIRLCHSWSSAASRSPFSSAQRIRRMSIAGCTSSGLQQGGRGVRETSADNRFSKFIGPFRRWFRASHRQRWQYPAQLLCGNARTRCMGIRAMIARGRYIGCRRRRSGTHAVPRSFLRGGQALRSG